MNQDDGPTADPAPPIPRVVLASEILKPWLSTGARWTARFLAVLNLLALIGHHVRGRAICLEILLYFPLLPLGGAALLAGAAIRALGSRKEGTATAQLGIAAIVVSCWWMIGRGPDPSRANAPPGPIVRVLHWNVLWGGFESIEDGWASMVDEMASRSPDIIVLSEAPPHPLRRQLLTRLGPGWMEIAGESPPERQTYKYRLVVLSRWPTRSAGGPRIRNGTAAEVIVDHPTRPIRILTIDGKSRPTIPRSSMLEDLIALCERAAGSKSGPIDVIAGDFNCVSRTREFDRLRIAAGGYSLASEASTEWRGTWPSWLPVYDIDHVWVRDAIDIRSCTLFSRLATDHRGQIVELSLKPPVTPDSPDGADNPRP